MSVSLMHIVCNYIKCFVGSNELQMNLAFKPLQQMGCKVHIEKYVMKK